MCAKETRPCGCKLYCMGWVDPCEEHEEEVRVERLKSRHHSRLWHDFVMEHGRFPIGWEQVGLWAMAGIGP